MVVLNRIYTKTGDGGETALGSGKRVPKDDLRIESYGTVDETNAAIGVARLHVEATLDAMLSRIQNDLFDLGADLAVPEPEGGENDAPPRARLTVTDIQVERLEHELDALNGHLSSLRSFVLPGGSAASAHLHVARTVCRRAERLTVALSRREKITPASIRYLNRLSDFLFVAARYANDKGANDVLWKPGANR